jgi:hypothetical protein
VLRSMFGLNRKEVKYTEESHIKRTFINEKWRE